jgi:single-strand DNA-binding protein
MASFNKVILLGNLTRDPEVRYTPKGSAVCDLGLAVNRNYTLDNGEKREEVTFVDVVLWARLAEIAGEYLKKGRPVFIEGRLQLDTWDDKQSGQKRSKLRVIGETMQLLGSRPGGGGGGESSDEERPARAAARTSPPPKAAGPTRTTTRFRFRLSSPAGVPALFSGSALVPSAGFGVSPKQSLKVREKSRFRSEPRRAQSGNLVCRA